MWPKLIFRAFVLPQQDEEISPHRPKHDEVNDGDQREDDRTSQDGGISCHLPLERHDQQLQVWGIAAGTKWEFEQQKMLLFHVSHTGNESGAHDDCE